MDRRVVVSGIGAVTPIGSGSSGLWHGVRRGTSAIGPLTRFNPAPYRSRLAAQINDFDPLHYLDARNARRLDRFAQLGVAAAIDAIQDAGIRLETLDLCRFGVSLGSALGGVAFGEQQHEVFLRNGMQAVSPLVAVAVYGGASGSNIGIHLGLRGPNLSSANSCASGTVAIGDAFRAIKRGDADYMLAGGVEAPLAPLTFGAFSVIKAMSVKNEQPESACRPFDRHRDGFVMGEGGALLLLEEYRSALRRDAQMYAEVLGFGHTNDAYHMTAPRPDGADAARAVRCALLDGAVNADDVGYVNAHATGTPLGDAAEARALRCALGACFRRVPVGATKALYGHPLGASGAIEAAITSMSLYRGFLPGTFNLDHPDPECDLFLLGSEGLERQAGVAVTTSFGFGGVNAALVLASTESGR